MEKLFLAKRDLQETVIIEETFAKNFKEYIVLGDGFSNLSSAQEALKENSMKIDEKSLLGQLLLGRKDKINLEWIKTQYGQRIPATRLFVNDNQKLVLWKIHCMSSLHFDLGCCSCNSGGHTPTTTEFVSLEKMQKEYPEIFEVA